jgi:hypothetical protein
MYKCEGCPDEANPLSSDAVLADVLAEIEEKSYETSIFLIIKRDILREILSKYFS